MKRVNIAMLSQSTHSQQAVIDENNEALVTDQNAAQLQQQSAQIDLEQQVVQETQDSADNIRQMADTIEQMPQVHEGVVQIAKEQMSYFVKRTGIEMIGFSAAVESFSPKNNSKDSIVKELKIAAEKLDHSVVIAQEGIIDRIKNSFSLLFTSNNKLKVELQDVSAKYDAAGAKTETIIDPAFARILNPKGQNQITGATTISLITDIRSMVKDPIIEKVVVRLTDILDKVTVALNKSYFIADDNEVKKLNDLFDEVDAMYNEIREKIKLDNAKHNADAVPLTSGDKQKIADITEELLDTAAYTRIEKDLNNSWWGFFDMYMSKERQRFIGFNAADMRAARNVNDKGSAIMSKINALMSTRFEVAHACVKYIKASTAR